MVGALFLPSLLLHDNHNKVNKRKEQKPSGNANNSKNEDNPVVLSFAQLEGKCYCCGKPGHKSPECDKNDRIPKDEWAINKQQQQFLQNQNTQDSDSSGKNSSNNDKGDDKNNKPTIGWADLHYNFPLIKSFATKTMLQKFTRLQLLLL